MTDYHAEVAHRWKELARIAAGIAPTKIPLEPSPSDILRVKDDLEVLISKVDPLIEAIAEYVEASTGYVIEHNCMTNQLLKALDGNLLYEIECAAEDVREQIMQAVA